MMQKKCNKIFERVYSKLKQSHLVVWCFPKTVREDIRVLGRVLLYSKNNIRSRVDTFFLDVVCVLFRAMFYRKEWDG